MVYSRVECVFILKHFFEWKLFSAVFEACNIAYLVKEISNNTKIRRLITFWDREDICVSSRRWWMPAVKLFYKVLKTTKATPKRTPFCHIIQISPKLTYTIHVLLQLDVRFK
jgi:hypothetical protein